MKHRVAGRKLGRTSSHRLALLRNLSRELFANERITTTLGKAKELRPFAEKLVTLAKRETLHSRRQVLRHIQDREVVAKMFDTISARFAQRSGGYTRIVKLGPRRGDNAEIALIELVGTEPKAGAKTKAEAETRQPRAETKKAKAGKPAAEKPPRAKKEGAGAEPKTEKKKAKAPKARVAKDTAAKPKASSKAKGATKTSAPRKSGGS